MNSEYEQIMEWVRTKDPKFWEEHSNGLFNPTREGLLTGPDELVVYQDGSWNASHSDGVHAAGHIFKGNTLAELQALYTPVQEPDTMTEKLIRELAAQEDNSTLSVGGLPMDVEEQAKQLEAEALALAEEALALDRKINRNDELRGDLAMLRMTYPQAAAFYSKAAYATKDSERIIEMRMKWQKAMDAAGQTRQGQY